MANPLMAFAANMIRNNPRVSQNPNAQQMIDVILSGDEVRGQQLADNICQSYGMSREAAVGQASSFFGFGKK